jgi:hypothetical protein
MICDLFDDSGGALCPPVTNGEAVTLSAAATVARLLRTSVVGREVSEARVNIHEESQHPRSIC